MLLRPFVSRDCKHHVLFPQLVYFSIWYLDRHLSILYSELEMGKVVITEKITNSSSASARPKPTSCPFSQPIYCSTEPAPAPALPECARQRLWRPLPGGLSCHRHS